MTSKDIVRDAEFKEVAQIRVDAKSRVVLGALSRGVPQFRVYRNSLGQIILDPQVTVSAYEAWLFKNPAASKAVRKGLAEAREGKTIKSKEDYSKYLE